MVLVDGLVDTNGKFSPLDVLVDISDSNSRVLESVGLENKLSISASNHLRVDLTLLFTVSAGIE